jgi:hypothetical protein
MDVYRRCLEEQLAEVELLRSMFPGPEELTLEQGDPALTAAWVEGPDGEPLPVPLELRLRLAVGEGARALELVAGLPLEYPALARPEVPRLNCLA